MAHEDNDTIPNVILRVELDLPIRLAMRWSMQTQYIISERMMRNVMSVLTDEQVAALQAANVEFQPVVFPHGGEVIE